VSGGLEGSVTQTTDAPGVMRSTSAQDERQTQDANTEDALTQTQEGPEFCCATQIGGTAANVNTVTQSNIQNQTTGTGPSSGTGQNSQQDGHCQSLEAECTVDQTYTTNNGGPDHFSETGPFVNHPRSCTGASEVDPCFESD
jgi:hypothetical protein